MRFRKNKSVFRSTAVGGVLILLGVLFWVYVLTPETSKIDIGMVTVPRNPLGNLRYQWRIGKLSLAYSEFTFEEIVFHQQEALRIHLQLRPIFLFRKISFDQIGFDITTILNKENLLPLVYEEIDIYRRKKGMSPKMTSYFHENLYMDRNKNIEGIDPDTRDLLSLFYWLMNQDYMPQAEPRIVPPKLNGTGAWVRIHSAMNINRRQYQVFGEAQEVRGLRDSKEWTKLVKLNLRFTELNFKNEPLGSFPITAYLIQGIEFAWPVRFNFRLGVLPVQMVLDY